MTNNGLPSFLNNENLRLIVFCGKGGTGKTTSAAATAVCLARLRPERKILVLSTDPAHSLGDSFGHPVGAERTPIEGMTNLSAAEMDSEGLLGDFKKKYSRELRKMVQRGSIIHQADVGEFLSFSLPDMDKIMTFLQINRVLTSPWYKPSECDLIVVDTPPTGHLLGQLSVLENRDKWIAVFKAALSKSLWFRGKRWGDDLVSNFVEEIRAALETVGSLVGNTQETEFVPIMIPETLSINETQDLLAALEEKRIPVNNIIVNRARGDRGCAFCSLSEQTEEESIAEIEEKFADYNLIYVPLFPGEIRGQKELAKVARILSGKTYRYRSRKSTKSLPGGFSVAEAKMSDLWSRDLQFILFSGKGGVGKTSISAATALAMARRYPNKKILVYSIDPAHSLADSFDCPIGDIVVSIPEVENLFAAEIDAAKLGEDFIREYKEIITDAFDTWEKKRGVRFELRFDRNILVSFAKAPPPGLNEVLALERVLNLVQEEGYDLCVLDMAPTGHALEVLEFQQLIRDWLSKTYRGLTKYDRDLPLIQLKTLADKIMKSTIAMRKIQRALTNPETSEFVAVTIPEAMAIAETKRLLSTIAGLAVPCHHIVINMLIPPTECSFCNSRRREQLRYVQELTEVKSPEQLVSQVPLFPYEIKGLGRLGELARSLFDSN